MTQRVNMEQYSKVSTYWVKHLKLKIIFYTNSSVERSLAKRKVGRLFETEPR